MLFWANTKQIFSCDLDGKVLQEIMFPEVLGNPRSRVKHLALDSTRRRLYFLAGFEDDDVWLMMSGNYDGSGFRRHGTVPRFTYAMAALGDHVYWVCKELRMETYSPKATQRFHSLVLYRGSTQLPGCIDRIMYLNTVVSTSV